MPLFWRQIYRTCWLPYPVMVTADNTTPSSWMLPFTCIVFCKSITCILHRPFDSYNSSLLTPLEVFLPFQTGWTTLLTAFEILLEAHSWSVVLVGVVFVGLPWDWEIFASFNLLLCIGFKVMRERIWRERETEKKQIFPVWQLSDFAAGLTGRCEKCLVSAVTKHSFWKCQVLAQGSCWAPTMAGRQAAPGICFPLSPQLNQALWASLPGTALNAHKWRCVFLWEVKTC